MAGLYNRAVSAIPQVWPSGCILMSAEGNDISPLNSSSIWRIPILAKILNQVCIWCDCLISFDCFWDDRQSLDNFLIGYATVSGLSFHLHNIIFSASQASPWACFDIQQSREKLICLYFENVYWRFIESLQAGGLERNMMAVYCISEGWSLLRLAYYLSICLFRSVPSRRRDRSMNRVASSILFSCLWAAVQL